MPQPVLINIKNASVRFADTEAGLASAPDFTCQVTSAAVTAAPNLATVPATFCAGQSQAPGATSWSLVVTWLQDWSADPAVSMSRYMYENDAELRWFSIEPVDVGLADVPGATGQCWIVAGAYLGDAGANLVATATCPLPAKPTIAPVAPGVLVGGPDDADQVDAAAVA